MTAGKVKSYSVGWNNFFAKGYDDGNCNGQCKQNSTAGSWPDF